MHLLNKIHKISSRPVDMTRSIAIFLAKDMRPYSVVEYEGFRHVRNNGALLRCAMKDTLKKRLLTLTEKDIIIKDGLMITVQGPYRIANI